MGVFQNRFVAPSRVSLDQNEVNNEVDMSYLRCFSLVVGLVFMSCFIQVSNASEDVPGQIIGKGISLFERGHAFAGSIADQPVFGVFDESRFGAKVQMRRSGKSLDLSLVKVGKGYQGVVQELRKDSSGEVKQLATRIQFLKIDRAGPNEARIHLKIDGVEVPVTVSSKVFKRGHFIAPHFEAMIGGQSRSFDFSGQACFGYAANIAMMVLGAATHLAK